MRTRFKVMFLTAILITFVFGGWASSAHAVLNSVGPREIPSPPGNGFPVWYQDTNGLTLDYCLPRNQVQLDAGVCLILPPPNPPPVFNLPFVFPTNYPDEAFYFNATGVMDLAAGFNAVLVLGLEGAFATGPVVPGDQITFGRLRIVIDAPVGGNYTVTTPYGVFDGTSDPQFNNVTPGKRAIVLPIDIGIGAPGDFTGALQSFIGPFLQASASEGGAPLAPVTIPGDPAGDLFLSDTALPVFVTGSPTNTNYFEICTDGGVFPINGQSCVKVNQFTLMGRIFNGTPFVVDKSYYVRDASGAGTVNVFGKTSSISATASYAVSGTGLTTTAMSKQAANGNLFASIPFTAGTVLPASVTSTATDAPKAPTAISTDLVDLVFITKAEYNGGTQLLTINAASGDQSAPPTLTATGLGTLVNGVLVVANVVAPPAFVTVTSSKGGTDTAIVTPPLPGTGVPPVISGIGPTTATVNVPYTNQVVATGVAPLIYSLDPGFPTGMTIDANGLIQWTPTTIGANPVTVRVSDAGGSAVLSFSIVVTALAGKVSNDYDGDGKTDIAVWRPSDGNWYILRSSDGGFTVAQWGLGSLNDVLVPGDYDGDGKPDIAVWRPSDGNWYILRSSDGSFTVTQWGTGTLFPDPDVPVPGDYDGDGKTDIAVWRPSDGNWYIIRSSDSAVVVTQWGTLGDVPIGQ